MRKETVIGFTTLMLFIYGALKLVVRRLVLQPLKYYTKSEKGHSQFSEVIDRKHFSFAQSNAFELSKKNSFAIFNVEGALLKSQSLFPYFMLVAFEGGSLIRAFFLLILYPFLTCFVQDDHEFCIRILVFVCFFGIKEEKFRVGRVVLPKFFLEDVGAEGFELLKQGWKEKVCVSDFPRVMVEGFLKDFLDIECVFARELIVWNGYFVGLMEEKKKLHDNLKKICQVNQKNSIDCVGITSSAKSFDHSWFSHCKEIFVVTDEEKRNWQTLPKKEYPKPLIFHDGRLAFKPTPFSMLAMFMWIPFGIPLSIIRVIIAISLPYGIALPILVFSGLQLKLTKPKFISNRTRGLLYVCNHKTLMDPVMLSFGLTKQVTACTYSVSRVSEIISPIKTVRLMRDRGKDGMIMEKFLSRGEHLVVCPEGTTCREPYLLRFSPLFVELSDAIVPVALNNKVDMFYATTAGGTKCLDPFYYLMNPSPSYSVQFLDIVQGITLPDNCGARSNINVANYVQGEIAKVLRFECTKLSRKDKYLVLAGNEGVV